MFGMGKTSAIRYIWQVLKVLESSIAPLFIKLPQSDSEWNTLQWIWKICGFPRACLAIDGFYEIDRPRDYEGWYCCKLCLTLNLQRVVDFKEAIRSYDFRAGLANDKAVFNYSEFGKNIHSIVPKRLVVVADAGYMLTDK